MKWQFSPKRPSDRTRDPVAGEFFSADAIKNAGEALVREAIQNSLDARIDKSKGKASVRIYVSGERNALSPSAHKRWFESIWPHYLAHDNGLRPGVIDQGKRCQFLVFEDFGTTGLVGDREQYEKKTGVRNPFFYFFRAEGVTEKAKESLGKWGIGKQVFPRSSKAQTFFGYSETTEGGFLMGCCILRHHAVGTVTYKPDGFWGETKDILGDAFTIPVSEEESLARFREDFKITRRPGQTGLSVVVPWLDEAETGTSRTFDKDTLAMAVIEGYFMPILEEKLDVSIEDDHGSWKITSENYTEVLSDLESRGGKTRVKDVARLKSHIKLAQATRSGDFISFELPPCAPDKPEWSDGMITEQLSSSVRECLSSGKVIMVKSTLTIRPKEGAPRQSEFRCFLRKEDNFSEKPCHIREDLIISNVESSRVNGFSCLIRVDQGPLAELLGDSENPAHTEWQKSSRNFKDKYTLGGVVIDYVSDFGAAFIRRVHSNSRQLDRKLLQDLFCDEGPESTNDKNRKKKRKKNGKGDDPEPLVLPPRPPAPDFNVSKTKNGFTLAPTEISYPLGTLVCVRVAYETTKGNAFSAYKTYDFNLASDGFKISLKGGSKLTHKSNVITFVIDKPTYSLTVSGFDVNRDLVVKPSIASTTDTEGESDS